MISWVDICQPKETEGLGIKEILGWNRASLINQVFELEGPVSSKWCAWVHEYKLRGRSVWDVSWEGASHSKSWRELMRARDYFQTHVTSAELHRVRENGRRGRIAMIYELLQVSRPICLWSPMVWHGFNLPKVSMIMWLACKG